MIPRGGKVNVRVFPQFSLTDLLPTHGKISEGNLLVILRNFFDGGNQADSTQYDCVTLAGMCGTKHQWHFFEREWKKLLKKHKAPFLHTTDAYTLNREFSSKNGWSEERVDAFLSDCVTVVGKHLALPRIGRMGIYPLTVTVDLKGYIEARKSIPGLGTATEICSTQAIEHCFTWGRYVRADYYHLFYDQGEAFRGHICDRLSNRTTSNIEPESSKIISNTEADMRHVPALQMADLFAWCVSHTNSPNKRIWHEKLLTIERADEYFDCARLLQPKPGFIERRIQWGLPRRKPTR